MKRNKYFAKKSHCNKGHTHASGKEARRCNDLHSLQDQGLISDLEVEPQFWFVIDGKQVKHQNGRRVGMKVDFRFTENERPVVEEVKAVSVRARGRDYALRKAIFKALFPHIDYREV